MADVDMSSKEYAINTLNDFVSDTVNRPHNTITGSLLLLQKILRKIKDESFEIGFQDVNAVIDCFLFGKHIMLIVTLFTRLNIEDLLVDILKVLVSLKFDVNMIKDDDGISLLTIACRDNKNKLARFLIENRASLTENHSSIDIDSHKYTENCPEDMYRYMLSSPFPCCVSKNNHEIFELILKSGVDITYEIEIESPVLKFAAVLSDKRMLSALVLLYKKYNCPDYIVFDAALCALIQGNIENFSILFGSLENKNYRKNGFNMMGCAILQKNIAAVKECLNIVNDIDEYCYDTDTPYELAVKTGSKDLIDLIDNFSKKIKAESAYPQCSNNCKDRLNFVAKIFGVDKDKRNFSAYIDDDTQFATKINIENEIIELFLDARLTLSKQFHENNNIIEVAFEADDNNKKFGYISKQDSKPVIDMYKKVSIANKSLQESELLSVVIYVDLHEIKENSELNEELYFNIDVEIIKVTDAIQLLHEKDNS